MYVDITQFQLHIAYAGYVDTTTNITIYFENDDISQTFPLMADYKQGILLALPQQLPGRY